MDGGGDRHPHVGVVSLLEEAQEAASLVGISPLFQQVLRVVDAVARNDCVVLLEGESGTGKELAARRIHAHGARAHGPFIPVNCPAITETLFESQFYGHVKGAFTGAATSSLGVVRAADGGTLLLDEVGELAFHLQPKLLRLLQEREVTPVGASRPMPVDVRFIAATNRNLTRCVAEGTFRADLYHRLNIVRIEIPPLRARPEDVEPLLDHYLAFYARQYGRSEAMVGQHLRQCLRQYPWPGNVRELCAYVERLYAADVPAMPPDGAALQGGSFVAPAPGLSAPDRMPLAATFQPGYSLADAERNAIAKALDLAGRNRSAAARILRIHRSTLLRKIRLLGLEGAM